jgi:hypothetical protein
VSLFVWLISHQPTVLLSQNKLATSKQPAVLLSQNKPAQAISHQPNEQASSAPSPGARISRRSQQAWSLSWPRPGDLPRRGSGCGISRRWHHTVQGANSSEAGCGIWHEDPRHRSQAGGRILHQIPLQGHHSIISLPLSSIISTLHHLPSIRGEMQILLCMPTRTIYFMQAVFNLPLQILIVLSIN